MCLKLVYHEITICTFFWQVLKQEISKARIRMMEPFLKGPAGLEYLKNAFANHYGSPSDAFTSLPLTGQWLSSVWNCKDQEWAEHNNSFRGLTNHVFLPSTTLRTGGSLLVKSSGSQATSPPASSITGLTVVELFSSIFYNIYMKRLHILRIS